MPKEAAIDPVAQTILEYVKESQDAKRKRMVKNQKNFECYNLEADWSHKNKGQSREFLGKQQMAVEQITSFLQQGIIDLQDWFDTEAAPFANNRVIDPLTLKRLLQRQLDLNSISELFADFIKSGLLGALMIAKVHGTKVLKKSFEVENSVDGRSKLIRVDKPVWQLKIEHIRQEDYFPDPFGDNLFEVQAIDMDWFTLMKLAEDNPGKFNKKEIESLQDTKDMAQEQKKARETNQNQALGSIRKRVRLFECWGTILDKNTKRPLIENGVCVIDSTGRIIREPEKNPWWHDESPFVVSPIVRVPRSVWHRALMDAPTEHNQALNEVYNLMVDGCMSEVHGIKQYREHWLDDPSQISDGIAPGTSLAVNSSCPPGAKVVERVDTGSLTPQASNMYGLMDREFQSSSLTNDVRMGNLPNRAVKATEIVASNQTITGIFNGIVQMIEKNFVSEILRKSALVIGQNMNDLQEADVRALVGPDKAILINSMSPQDRFKEIADGSRFKVFGLSTILNRINDFRKLTSLLQVISGSADLTREFIAKYSFTKFMGEIIKSLDIDEEKIRLSDEEKAQKEKERQIMFQAQLQGAANAKEGPDMQSQIANAGDMAPETGMPHQGEMQMGLSTGEVMGG